METTQLNLKNIIIFLLLLIMTFLFFKGCGEKSNLQVKNDRYKKSNDSLNVVYQKTVLNIEKYERDIYILRNDLAKAKVDVKKVEVKYNSLKNKTVKPKYIELIADCNDTIQSIYKRSIEKDSLCDIVVEGKNFVIVKQDSIITLDSLAKKDLFKMVDIKSNENKNLESVVLNNKKEIRNEKVKKNFWKISSISLIGVILKMVIFK